jgi:serine/threonine protein kinase
MGYEPTYVHGEQCKTTSLSAEGAHLLELLLAVNPEKRISAADALEHPYFEVSPDPLPLTPEHLAQLKRDRSEALINAKKVSLTSWAYFAVPSLQNHNVTVHYQVAAAKAEAEKQAKAAASFGMQLPMGMQGMSGVNSMQMAGLAAGRAAAAMSMSLNNPLMWQRPQWHAPALL